jgi:hypothetical protein
MNEFIHTKATRNKSISEKATQKLLLSLSLSLLLLLLSICKSRESHSATESEANCAHMHKGIVFMSWHFIVQCLINSLLSNEPAKSPLPSLSLSLSLSLWQFRLNQHHTHIGSRECGLDVLQPILSRKRAREREMQHVASR